MPDNQPTAARQSTVVQAANQLLPVLAELEHMQHRHVELQRKSQKTTDRILGLARAQIRDWSDNRQSELVRLEATANALQLKLAATQRSTSRLRRRLETALGKFRTVFSHHDAHLAALQFGSGRMHRQNAGLDRSLRYLLRRMSAKLMPKTDGDAFQVPGESHEYIAIGIPYFMDMLTRLDGILSLDPDYADPKRRYSPVSFLEVGSGSGRNMMLVKTSEILLWDRVRGFDINPDQIAEGATVLDLGDSLEVADALTFDYGGYDVIFSYRPFSDLDVQETLEARIVETMSPAAYLVAALPYDLALYPSLVPTDSQSDIWKKTKPA